MTGPGMVRAAVVPHLLTAIAAAGVALATAIVASRWFPVGFAARIDPDRGFRVSRGLLALGIVTMTAAVMSVAAFAAWQATLPARRSAGRDVGPVRTGIRRVRPLSVGLGASLAFEGEAGRARTGATSALIAAAAALAGVVGTIGLNHSVKDALRHPERAGVVWDAVATPSGSETGLGTKRSDLGTAVAEQPSVAAVATVLRALTPMSGTAGKSAAVPTFTVEPVAGKPTIAFSFVRGRLPSAPAEVAVGPATAKKLAIGVGDSITLADGTNAGVVGIALFPNDVHSAFDEGALVTSPQFDALDRARTDQSPFFETIAIRFRPGNRDEQIGALGEAVGSRTESIEAVSVPLELTNLRNVRSLPLLLATFLSLLGVSAIGHALVTSVRLRTREIAVLRALGMTRGSARAMVGAQGTAIAFVGLLVGVPVGIIAGRLGWRAITDRVPLTFVAPLALVALILVVPLALAAANALAVLPGRHAARLQPAGILRSRS